MRADYARRHPEVPEAALPRPSFKVKTANGLTKAIIEWVRLHGGQAERVSVTGRTLDQRKHFIDVLGHHRSVGQVKWIPPSMQKGTADISATIHGRSVKLEIKIGKDFQKPAQVEYQRQVEAAGGIYVIIKDFDMFYQWWKEFYRNGT